MATEQLGVLRLVMTRQPAVIARGVRTDVCSVELLSYGGEMDHSRQVDSVPEWLMKGVLAPVLADLQQPNPVALELRVQDALIWFSELGQTGSFGVGVPDPQIPQQQLLVEFADRLQEQFFPETRAAWGQARPACPGHPHPAAATVLTDEAWWVCPVDQTRISPIGAFHPSRSPRKRRRDQ